MKSIVNNFTIKICLKKLNFQSSGIKEILCLLCLMYVFICSTCMLSTFDQKNSIIQVVLYKLWLYYNLSDQDSLSSFISISMWFVSLVDGFYLLPAETLFLLRWLIYEVLLWSDLPYRMLLVRDGMPARLSCYSNWNKKEKVFIMRKLGNGSA